MFDTILIIAFILVAAFLFVETGRWIGDAIYDAFLNHNEEEDTDQSQWSEYRKLEKKEN